jgi:centromeric protein E
MKGSEDEPGILPLSLHQIFSMIREIKDREFLLRVSYLEVYNEQVRDLLEDDAEDLEIHEDKKRGFFVKDMREVIVTSVADALTLLAEGEDRRHFGRTNANEMSSRSHVIFRVVIESEKRESDSEVSTASIAESAPVRKGLPKIPEPEASKVRAAADNEKVLVSTLNFVDLAGSERAAQTGGVGDRQKEGRSINKSLLFLGIVISKLSEGDR